jgi:hypothetical protein
MRLAGAALCLVLAGSAHAEDRWSDEACKNVSDLEQFYSESAPDLTSKAWAVRPLLVLQRDHCGIEIKMKLDETDKVIKRRLWPEHVCAVLSNTKHVRSMLAKQLDEHCSEAGMVQQKARN